MKHFVMLYQIITIAQANVLHGVEQWFTPELNELSDHFLTMIRYYQDAGELTQYQAKKLRQMVKDFPKICQSGKTHLY